MSDASESETPLDVTRIVTTLDRHGVEYLIVGGVGGQIHGAQRPTMDLDAMPLFTTDNLARLAAAMRELGARIRATGLSDEDAKAAADAMLHPDMFRSAQLTTWRTDAGPLDVLHDIPDGSGARRPFDQMVARSEEVELAGVVVRVASLEDIISSKEFADRAEGPRGAGRTPRAAPSRNRLSGLTRSRTLTAC